MDTISFVRAEPPTPEFDLRAGPYTPPFFPGSASKIVGSTTPTVQFPLGSTFFLELRDRSSGFPIPVSSGFTTGTATVDAGVEAASIFPARCVFAYDKDTPATRKVFQAVHLGVQDVIITPETSTSPPVTVRVVVFAPAQLGSGQFGFDDYFVKAGHKYGIPPNFIKAQANEEAHRAGAQLDGAAFRYEPCGADLAYMSVGVIDLTRNPYALYRFETATLPRSSSTTLTPDDIAPRSEYEIVRQRRGLPCCNFML